MFDDEGNKHYHAKKKKKYWEDNNDDIDGVSAGSTKKDEDQEFSSTNSQRSQSDDINSGASKSIYSLETKEPKSLSKGFFDKSFFSHLFGGKKSGDSSSGVNNSNNAGTTGEKGKPKKIKLNWHENCEKEIPFRDKIKQLSQKFKKLPTSQRPRALVTGGAGFVGSHVAEFLAIDMNFSVIVFDDLSNGSEQNIISSPYLEFVKGDVQDSRAVQGLWENYGPFDYVYHFASYGTNGLSHFIRRFNYKNNVVGFMSILDAAANQHADGKPIRRFVYGSSTAVYGRSLRDEKNLPLTESIVRDPEDPFGIGRWIVEKDLQAANNMFDFDYTIFRTHSVYGPRMRVKSGKFKSALGHFLNVALSNNSEQVKTLTVYGDGEQKRGFSYIDDVAPVIAGCVLYELAANEDFIVGADGKLSINKLAQAVKEMTMTESANEIPIKIEHAQSKHEAGEDYANHDKLRCVFNVEQPTSMPEGLEKTIAYVRKAGKKRKFINVAGLDDDTRNSFSTKSDTDVSLKNVAAVQSSSDDAVKEVSTNLESVDSTLDSGSKFADEFNRKFDIGGHKKKKHKKGKKSDSNYSYTKEDIMKNRQALREKQLLAAERGVKGEKLGKPKQEPAPLAEKFVSEEEHAKLLSEKLVLPSLPDDKTSLPNKFEADDALISAHSSTGKKDSDDGNTNASDKNPAENDFSLDRSQDFEKGTHQGMTPMPLPRLDDSDEDEEEKTYTI